MISANIKVWLEPTADIRALFNTEVGFSYFLQLHCGHVLTYVDDMKIYPFDNDHKGAGATRIIIIDICSVIIYTPLVKGL